MSQPIISEIEVDKKAFKSRGYESLWLINNGFKSNKVKVQGSKLIYPQSNRKVDPNKQKVKLNPSAVDEEEGLVQPSHVVFVVQAPAKPKKAVSVKTLSGATRVIKDVPAAVPKRTVTISTSPRKIVPPASVSASGASVTVNGSTPSRVITTKVTASPKNIVRPPAPEVAPAVSEDFEDLKLKNIGRKFEGLSAIRIMTIVNYMFGKEEPVLENELADGKRGRNFSYINTTLRDLDAMIVAANYYVGQIRLGVINATVSNTLDGYANELAQLDKKVNALKTRYNKKLTTSSASAKAHKVRK